MVKRKNSIHDQLLDPQRGYENLENWKMSDKN